MLDNKKNIGYGYSFKKLSTKLEICKALIEISDAHTPSLIEKIPNIDEYASKLFYKAEVYVSFTEPKILGLIAFYANDKKSKISYISQIAVQIYAQNMHIGKQLLDICFQVSKRNKMHKVKLEVNKNNKNAIRFYKKNGFEFCDEASIESFYMIKNLLCR